MPRSAFFHRATPAPGGTRLSPSTRAASGWAPEHMRGMAVSAALAREAETLLAALDRSGCTPVRWSIDLFRPTRMADLDVSAAVVRNGRRYCLIDVVATQQGRPTARATGAFAVPGGAHSRVWTSDDCIAPPQSDGDEQPDHVERFYWDEHRGWLTPGDGPYSNGRTGIWHFPVPAVEGERPSAFVFAAAVADVVNAAANVGPDGLAFINTDASLHLSRAPRGRGLGIVLTNRTEHHGLSAGAAVVFDRSGAVGTVTATGLANPPIALLDNPVPPDPQSPEPLP